MRVRPHRYGVVGVGARAAVYIEALATTYAERGEIIAWCDPSPTRMSFYDRVLERAGHPAPARYRPDGFPQLLAEQRPDGIVVTSPDHTHHTYVVAALDAGIDVIVEKPLATSVTSARAIAQAADASSAELVVTFNYRYAPRNSELRRILAEGSVGDVTSVHFEWALDTVHGADYFRRWHRDRTLSGGLLVHKSSHHFDLVNWWLDDDPQVVHAAGALQFYGRANAVRRGALDRRVPAAGPDADPFALDLAGDDVLRQLHLEAESEDGYVRNQDVFGDGITIEDNAAVLVTYASSAILSYSLNAHAPWEGYRVSINGTEGRAELEVVERGHVASEGDGGGHAAVDPSIHPNRPGRARSDDPRPAGQRLLVQRHWERARELPIPRGEGPHGGGDARLLDDLFGADPQPDPLRRRAEHRDGLRSLAVGLAANRSIATGRPVRVDDGDLALGRH